MCWCLAVPYMGSLGAPKDWIDWRRMVWSSSTCNWSQQLVNQGWRCSLLSELAMGLSDDFRRVGNTYKAKIVCVSVCQGCKSDWRSLKTKRWRIQYRHSATNFISLPGRTRTVDMRLALTWASTWGWLCSIIAGCHHGSAILVEPPLPVCLFYILWLVR